MKKCTDCKFLFIREGKVNWCEKCDRYICDQGIEAAEECEEYEEA